MDSDWSVDLVCKLNSICHLEMWYDDRSNPDIYIHHVYDFIYGEEYTIFYRIWDMYDSYHSPYIILGGIDFRLRNISTFEKIFLTEPESREYKINKLLLNK